MQIEQLEEEEHSIQALRAKYQAMISVQILDVVIRCLIGSMWALITYSSILAFIKLFRIVSNQYKYNYYRDKWEKEVTQYEDEDCINQTNEKYKKIIIQYHDRLEKYDKKIQQGLYRYTFLIILVFGLNIAWWYFDYMRSCMGYGFVVFIIYQTYCFLDRKYIQPYFERRAQEKEKKRLDAEIAKNKKQN
ncbi:unnamed protein product (macronuclear) [Paramecium tetraurelia]|uniref:Calcium uniporter protein n=1 Tax=Paramecium tetraurelia TaxID=5888 RepID=A0EDS5_PARTE|nr:uncharacterized protein GSPATT00025786001 [Paramecium tetraurelia]CAK93442.1 unnamed protein product [Paramecium tetraurelia]|eukprot:XP_001460839.1 hypothetical protein (macronuclear) [Paramecium tetraurelia strain d4-2]